MDSKELERTLSILNDAAQSGKDFVWEQAPMVAKEVVYWHIGEGTVAFLFSLLITVVALLCIRNAVLTARDPKMDWDCPSPSQFFSIIGGAAALIACAISLLCLYDASKKTVQGAIAPRLVIIEYVANVVKK